jgi:hypothetical protein
MVLLRGVSFIRTIVFFHLYIRYPMATTIINDIANAILYSIIFLCYKIVMEKVKTNYNGRKEVYYGLSLLFLVGVLILVYFLVESRV